MDTHFEKQKGWRWVTVQQAADFLGCSTSKIYRLMKDGKLKYEQQSGRQRRIKLNRFHIPREFRRVNDESNKEGSISL